MSYPAPLTARLITVRPAAAADQAYVAATFAEQLSRGVRGTGANATVDRVLDSSAARVLVAIEAGRIVGWLAYAAIPRVRAVLYAYVRKPARGAGVARALANAAWPSGSGSWVHAGFRGGSIESLLARYNAVEIPLDELL